MTGSTRTSRTGRSRGAAGSLGRRGLPALSVAALAALALSGCSGGSSTSNSADATPAAPQSSASSPATDTAAASPTGSASASAAAATPTASASPTATGPKECATSDLQAAVVPGPSAAGQRYSALVLTNTSPGSCFVVGYPGLQLLSSSGAKVPTDVVRDSGTVKRITLAKGAKASSLLHWSVVPGPGEPTDKPCEPTAATLQVTPPDQTTQLTTSWSGDPVCLKGRIDVKPFVAGADPQP